MKSRRQSRETVFALLFEWSFKEDKTSDELVQVAVDARDIKLDEFATQLLVRTLENSHEIDATIEEHSEKWRLNRISKVSLACLRMALCEMMYFEDIPEGATINEAIEMVKKYGTEEEAAYTNGILGAYSRSREGLG